ncbi:unnamed protein product [Leptosia nina]|uniref:Rad21/Rec8-like protein N-terminal domain-containing protein n=1 Tax=Leptosia nina TaxID=320188 RepID=A0AAV1IZK7_9NEOP
MFFDEDLINDPQLSKAWKAAHSVNLPNKTSEEGSICKLTAKITERISEDRHIPKARLSLRTASCLVDGTVKLHAASLNKLMKDKDVLQSDIESKSTTNEGNDLSDTQEDFSLPESKTVSTNDSEENRSEEEPEMDATTSKGTEDSLKSEGEARSTSYDDSHPPSKRRREEHSDARHDREEEMSREIQAILCDDSNSLTVELRFPKPKFFEAPSPLFVTSSTLLMQSPCLHFISEKRDAIKL